MITPISFESLVEEVAKKSLFVTSNSNLVTPGSVFVALPPALPHDKMKDATGGEVFISDAIQAGARYIVLSGKHENLLRSFSLHNDPLFFVSCDSTREALGKLASVSKGTDKYCPTLIGITGTNGKTTESYLLEHLFTSINKKVGVIGTVQYRWPGYTQDSPLTTPGCVMLHDLIAKMHKAEVDIVFMEISSHALDQDRIAGLNFSGALITNLTQDHLDYHSSMEDYFQAKAKLFRNVNDGGVPYDDKVGACNADDQWCQRLLKENKNLIGYGLLNNSVPGARYLHGKVVSISPDGMLLRMKYEENTWEIFSPLVGNFNAMNLIGVQAMGLALGLTIDDFQSLESFHGVPGRLERVVNPKGLHLFVDYAHTPDALANAIQALRATGFRRIVTVFGCGGDRDKTKRPLMGQVVANCSDVAILTSDNPRTEDPEAIIADVLPGLSGCKELFTIPDRRAALKKGLEILGAEDALLVAGKGHESYQLIGTVKYPFSDQSVLRELIGCA